MSKIGQKPIHIPKGVTISFDEKSRLITVKGPRGELSRRAPSSILILQQNGAATVNYQGDSNKALWGTWRAHLANMVKGVSEGYTKKLELIGVGYRASLDNKTLVLQVGFSHPVTILPPEGVSFDVEKNMIKVSGNDKELVGHIAAKIRAVRPPEPYKGKGIRYEDEVVRRKEGKKAVGSE